MIWGYPYFWKHPYGQRLAPYLAAVRDSNKILKLNAVAPKANIIKKLIAFMLLKDLGLRHGQPNVGEYTTLYTFYLPYMDPLFVFEKLPFQFMTSLEHDLLQKKQLVASWLMAQFPTIATI